MRADVEVEPGAVAQEDVAAAAPADDLAEQVTGDLVRRETALPLEGAGDAVLVLDPEDPPVHDITLCRSCTSRWEAPLGDRYVLIPDLER